MHKVHFGRSRGPKILDFAPYPRQARKDEQGDCQDIYSVFLARSECGRE